MCKNQASYTNNSGEISGRDTIFDAIKGIIVGTAIGGLAGLGVCIWLLPENLLFPGDTMLVGAVICGVLGHIYGDSFFEWLGENWHHWI